MKNSTFVKMFNQITKEVPFNDEWPNGTGYFNGVVNDKKIGLEPGQLAKSVAPGEDKRKLIIVGTRFGNVVVFERYSPKEDQPENIPVVSNAPQRLTRTKMVIDGAMSDDHFETIVGWISKDGTCYDNVGIRIEYLVSPLSQRELLLAEA